ncbi:hypothetical protein [Rickettsiella endosymbiont of Rhagonycha lignosa]|uniref:hypothetical protein n=1 Tax=Rickettsiella endosymbiont of Rhagonycha lignosa TaxID=3077937 RepID=UPI00313F3893
MDNKDTKIILFPENSNSQDALGRTPLHDFAMGKGVIGPMTSDYAAAAIVTINFLEQLEQNGARFDIKDIYGKTPLDYALMYPIHPLLAKEYIRLSLKQNPNLAQPAILDEPEKKELLECWKNCQKEVSAPLETNLPENVSGSSAGFFPTSTSSNSDTYVEGNVQIKPQFN